MKIFKRHISAKDGSGTVVLRPETSDDLWHCYNLLQRDDEVRCTTLRKVVKESSTGSTSSQKRRLNLTIRIERVEFDAPSLEVRLSGPTTVESDHVRMGSYHTLTLELNQNFHLEKGCWDRIHLDRIEEACHPQQAADMAAIVMQSSGLAHVCLVTGSLTIVRARIDQTIPKKRTGSSQHSRGCAKFFHAVYQSLTKLPWDKLKCCLLGSPGYVKDDFFRYMTEEMVKRDDRMLIENKSKFVLCRASSGHKHALDEIFSNAEIMGRMESTKVAREVEALHRFLRMMDTDPHRAYYGFAHVSKARDLCAIDSLLIADELFRSADVPTRKRYVALVESVKENGGRVHLFSSMHVSGQQLNQVSGIAAILRYPLPEIEEEIPQDDDDDDAEFDFDDDDDDDDEASDAEKRIRDDMEDMGLYS